MRKITCGPDNTESFKKELRAALPGVFPFIRGLYDLGMIDGLRGTTLTYLDEQPKKQEVQREPEIIYCCQDCQFFQKDTVGHGMGIGQCEKKVITRKLKYPKLEACEIFKGKADD